MTTPPAPLRPRPAAFVAIAAVHFALLAGIGPSASRVSTVGPGAPIEVTLSTETRLPDPAPKVDPAWKEPVLPSIEPPLIEIRDAPPPLNAITVAATESPPGIESAPARIVTVAEVAYLTPPRPHYPAESRRSGEQGLVLLRVMIDELGRAARIEIQRSSGYARLDAAARDAVEHAVFRPYLEDGVARTVFATIPIEFNWKPRGAEGSRRS